jgi:signal transduction histidine kinase
VLVLGLNFVSPQSVNYLEINSLQFIELWGGVSVPVARGVTNPWNALAGFSYALFGLFVADASVQLWRRNGLHDRRRAVLIGGSLAFLVFFSAALILPTHWGVLTTPYVVAWLVLGPLFAMGYELVEDVFHATQLARRVAAGEAQVRENAERLGLALKGARLAFWDWDIASGKVYLSDRWHEMLGGAAQPLVTTFPALAVKVHPDDFPELRRHLREALKGIVPAYEVDHRVRTPSGEWLWIHSRGEVVARNANGRALRMAGVNEDITARRNIEMEAAQRRSELAHLSRVAMLGELSGAVAHELNQPLAAILSNAQAAQRILAGGSQHAGEVREILDDIVEDNKRAGAVIRGLRVLLRKEEVAHHSLDINDVALDVLRLMRSDLLNRNVRWNTNLAAGLPRVLGDGIQLQQVLLNLVMNACDAVADNKGEERRLEVRTGRGESGSVLASVSDRGKGIPAGDLQRVFEPFITTKPHGMGLGLSVCKTIVEAHRGHIWAKNNAGPGATVCVELPAHAESVA